MKSFWKCWLNKVLHYLHISIEIIASLSNVQINSDSIVPSKQEQIFVVCLNRVLLIYLSSCLSCSVKRKILQVELSISTISKSDCALCVKYWLFLSLSFIFIWYPELWRLLLSNRNNSNNSMIQTNNTCKDYVLYSKAYSVQIYVAVFQKEKHWFPFLWIFSETKCVSVSRLLGDLETLSQHKEC